MTIGILYICTGKYAMFWEGFHASCEKCFLPEAEKRYFVFTDADLPPARGATFYQEEPKGFPMDSLLRFDMFDRVKADVAGCDYVFFFNANMRFMRTIAPDEILPRPEDGGIVAVSSPGYYNKPAMQLPFERRKRSAAYIPYRKGDTYHYFMGGLYGGTYEAYYQMVEACRQTIGQDIKAGVLAVYHDESHLNRYLHGRPVRHLSPAYGYPEGWQLPFEPAIVILDKIKHGGKYFDKLPRKALAKRIYLFVRRNYRAIRWRIGI